MKEHGASVTRHLCPKQHHEVEPQEAWVRDLERSGNSLLHSHRGGCIVALYGFAIGGKMGGKTDVWQGTLELNYGTLYPALLKLEQEGYIRSRWGASENNRKAKFYELTKAGQRQVRRAAAEWEQTTEILAKFLTAAEGA